jgi:hypothetical protein
MTYNLFSASYPSVQSFGADLTGTVDSTPAFLAALTASKVVIIPNGSYKLNNLQPPSGSSLIGFAGKGYDTGATTLGAKIFALNSSTTNIINIDGKTDILLQGMQINGTGATTCNGISAGGNSITLRDLSIRNCTGFGIGGAPAGGSLVPCNFETTIDQCDVYSCGTGIGDLIDGWIYCGSLTSNTNNLVFTSGNSGEVNIVNTRIEWATSGYGFVNSSNFGTPNPGSKVKFTNCQFDRNWNGACNLNGCNYVQFDNCGFWRNGNVSATGSVSCQVLINGASHISFHGCMSNFGQDDASTGNISPPVWVRYAGTNSFISFVGNDLTGYTATNSATAWFAGTAPTVNYIVSKNFGTGTPSLAVDV